jgi:tetratricopeptide (TPR) repeat protein
MNLRSLRLGFVILLLTSAYLYARADASLVYFTALGLHIALGVGLAVAAIEAIKRAVLRTAGFADGLVAALLTGTTLAGAAILVVGATRPFRWLLMTHVICGAAAALVLAGRWLFGGSSAGAARWLGFASLLVLGVGVAGRYYDVRAFRAKHRIENPTVPPMTMDGEGGGPKSPFFPSSAKTNVGGIIPANFFMTSRRCGSCHKDIYDQWNASVHHFSSFNNQWYRKSIEYMQDVVGTKPSRWCAGCHDHAVFFNGRFDRPIKEQIDTPEAQNGLGCTSCHSITHVGSTMGQGDFTIEYPPLHDLAVSDNPVLAWTHDYLLKIDPEPHRRTFLKPFHTDQTADFCSSCHKVHLDVPVNGYRWIRGFNEYDNWQASGVSGQGARSFYYPAKAQKCADCHMPLVASEDPGGREGKIHSHRFPGANTAIPFVNKDATQMKVTQDFLRDGQITVDIFGLARGGEVQAAAAAGPGDGGRIASTFAVGEESSSFGGGPAVLTTPVEVIAPIDKVGPTVQAGEDVRVDVVVRTRKVGHFFPGGTVDAFDVWVELAAVDGAGRTIFHSGSVRDGGKGPVEGGAHFYRSLQLDEHGNPINKRNAWMTRSVAYVRLIPPGAADTVRYRLLIPSDATGPIQLKAKVNYRKFAWWNTQWAFAGVRDPEHRDYSLTANHDDGRWIFTGDTSRVSGEIKAIPDIPITVVAEATSELKVVPKGAVLPGDKPVLQAAVRERWNDYGIGLLLQGDLRAAEAAFLRVTEMEPGYADGWVNVGRARFQEGNLDGAEEVLRKALAVDGKLAKTHFFLGSVLKNKGLYDDALGHLQKAAELYPQDRVVRNQLGRVLFLKREFAKAIAELEKVLRVDPEDLQAHYNMMLSYQGLGDSEKAERERKLYERFKADEAAQFITGPYRQLHPDDNNERQSIHEHGTSSEVTYPNAPVPAKRKPQDTDKILSTAGGSK